MLPVPAEVDPDADEHPHVLHRGAARLPAEQVGHARWHLPGALQPALPRRSAHPHHARLQPAAGRPRSPATSSRRTRRDSTRRSCRSIPRRARSGPWSVARASSPAERETNMALVPRQTGSSIKFFILAAAVQAGAQPGDIIDGKRTVHAAEPRRTGGAVRHHRRRVAGGVDTLAEQTWRVDQLRVRAACRRSSASTGWSTRRIGWPSRRTSTWASPTSERAPIQPFASFATGANEMSPLDMASGIQTLANEGCTSSPISSTTSTTPTANRVYTHLDPGTQVLDRGRGLPDRRHPEGRADAAVRRAAIPWPMAGPPSARPEPRTATRTRGSRVAHRQLSTAVWVGDPDAYTPMDNIPEFVAAGVRKVQGGTFPAQDLEDVHGCGTLRRRRSRTGRRRPRRPVRTPGCTCRATSASSPSSLRRRPRPSTPTLPSTRAGHGRPGRAGRAGRARDHAVRAAAGLADPSRSTVPATTTVAGRPVPAPAPRRHGRSSSRWAPRSRPM